MCVSTNNIDPPPSLMRGGGVKKKDSYMKFKTLATESLINSFSEGFTVNRGATILGKSFLKIPIYIYLNDKDGSIDLDVVKAYNEFFVNIDKTIEKNLDLILEAVKLDAQGASDKRPLTAQDLRKNFNKLTSCFVRRDRLPRIGNIPGGEHIIAHCSLEWLWDLKSGYNDERFDAEHGNGLAMIDGKFVMGKPGDFY